MSLSRNQGSSPQTRDVKADYIAAYLAEYESCRRSGQEGQAAVVAEELRKLGYALGPVKERAVSPEPLEKAVEGDEAPKRRGRPRKTE